MVERQCLLSSLCLLCVAVCSNGFFFVCAADRPYVTVYCAVLCCTVHRCTGVSVSFCIYLWLVKLHTRYKMLKDEHLVLLEKFSRDLSTGKFCNEDQSKMDQNCLPDVQFQNVKLLLLYILKLHIWCTIVFLIHQTHKIGKGHF